MSLIIRNCRVLDGIADELTEVTDVLVADGRIQSIGRQDSAKARTQLDADGRVLMPGLIDAHFHAVAPTISVAELDQMPPMLLGQHARHILEGALQRGFTTVRDAAGADHGLHSALEQGLIRGPRLFFAGKALSQTGGHGDLRSPDAVSACSCGYAGTLARVVDGADAVRHAVREELRRGAHQIKLMLSGGILSPSDPIWMRQFTDDEVSAAVEETATRRTYVMAHAHTAEAARRCVRLGIRSIEHGTMIDAEAAAFIAASDTYVVPTLSILKALVGAARRGA